MMLDNMAWEFVLRIFVAALLGGIIGLEREYRAKEAGFRTHFLVALGSALFMMLVSGLLLPSVWLVVVACTSWPLPLQC